MLPRENRVSFARRIPTANCRHPAQSISAGQTHEVVVENLCSRFRAATLTVSQARVCRSRQATGPECSCRAGWGIHQEGGRPRIYRLSDRQWNVYRPWQSSNRAFTPSCGPLRNLPRGSHLVERSNLELIEDTESIKQALINTAGDLAKYRNRNLPKTNLQRRLYTKLLGTWSKWKNNRNRISEVGSLETWSGLNFTEGSHVLRIWWWRWQSSVFHNNKTVFGHGISCTIRFDATAI